VKRIVGLLGWLGVVLVLASVAILALGQTLPIEWQPWRQRLALAGLVVTAIYALSQWRDIARSFQGRNAKYGSIAAGSAIVLLAILVGIYWIAKRQNKRWDLTSAQQFSMSDQTRSILTNLRQPIAIRAYYDPQAGSQALRDVLDEYQYISKQVQVEYIDAIKDPVRTRQDAITEAPTLVLQSGDKTERVTGTADEQNVTNAIKKLVEGKTQKVYFVQGHGERDTDDTQPGGYAGLASGMKNDNFDIAKLTLAQTGKVPDDAALVVIAGPKTDYLPPEVDAIRGYLLRGGKVVMMIDPPEKVDSPQPTSLIAFAKEWGIDVGNNLVVDMSGYGQVIGAGPAVPIAMPAAGGHPITRDFRLITAFPLTRSVTPIEGGVSGRTAQRVLETSPQSWAETDLKELYTTGKPKQEADKGDTAGPVGIAAAVSAPPASNGSTAAAGAESRLVVIGDSDFASNRFLGTQGNKDLALNAANWAVQQEDLIAIRPKAPDDRRISLTAAQVAMLFWATVVVIPLLFIGNAVRVWWRRR
jgi:ABC-type uncharacterized transport system involved in gliding motility auxiliary subunit